MVDSVIKSTLLDEENGQLILEMITKDGEETIKINVG